MQKTIIILNIECIIKKVLSEKKEKKRKSYKRTPEIEKKKKNRIWIKFLQKSIYIYIHKNKDVSTYKRAVI